MSNVLIVAAHPDDEVLGAGGTIIKHKDQGDKVYCLVLGTGVTARSNVDWEKNLTTREETTQKVERLRENALIAARILGFDGISFDNFPDNAFDAVPLLHIVKKIEKFKASTTIDTVYTHWEHDINIDHQLTFQAVLTAFRPKPHERVKEIYSFEVLSSSEWGTHSFNPNVYVDITNTYHRKLKAFKEYRGDVFPYPHPRSIQGVANLAVRRGMECGVKVAEAFEVVRIIR